MNFLYYVLDSTYDIVFSRNNICHLMLFVTDYHLMVKKSKAEGKKNPK